MLAAALACLGALTPEGFLAAQQPASPSASDPAGQTSVGPEAERLDAVVARAVDSLKVRGQAADGSFSRHAGSGVTALATTALLRSGCPTTDPAVAKGLRYLEECVRPDGAIHPPDSLYRNYETSLAILCFTEANADGRYDAIIERAEAWVKRFQWDESEDVDPSDPYYGGAGYGKHERPDLSNTSFLVDALHACGNGPDDEALCKALVFVSRCQNLETEHNTTPFAAKINDGGFYYTCAASGQSKVGETPNGGLRSYASMTYAGLKSLLYAGVGPDDPRVKAAVDWIRSHYDLESNPGLGGQGLYYYYHVFAKALDAVGIDRLENAAGVKHDWRRDLAEELARRQQSNGCWVNETTRWMEGDPNLVTAYALLALSYCRPQGRSAGEGN